MKLVFVRLFVCMSLAPSTKMVPFRAIVTIRKTNRKPHAGSQTHHSVQCGHMATGSGQNVLEVEKFTSSVSWKPIETEPWLLLNASWKSQAACHWLWSSILVTGNHRKGPKWHWRGIPFCHHWGDTSFSESVTALPVDRSSICQRFHRLFICW